MSKYLEIPLREFDEKDITSAIKKLEDCELLISERLVDCVKLYEGIKLKNSMKETASRVLSTALEEIDSSDGWNIFVKFFDIKTRDNEAPKLAAIMPLISEFIKPVLPWSRSVKCPLFKKETEKILLNPGIFNINFDQFLGQVVTFEPLEAETIKRMQTGVYRNKVIIDLLMNIGLMEALDLKPKLEIFNQAGEKISEKTSPKIDGTDLKKYIKEIFLDHYAKEKENVEKQNIFPKLEQINEESWNTLLESGEKLKQAILQVKAKYLDSIVNHQFSEKLQVFDAIRNFLRSNKLDEENPLSIPELQSKYKAYGLVKKISKGPGMAAVKKEYLSWLIREKEKENDKIDPLYTKKTIDELANYHRVKPSDIKQAISYLKIEMADENDGLNFEDQNMIKERLIELFNPYTRQSAASKRANNASNKNLRRNRDMLKLSKENSK